MAGHSVVLWIAMLGGLGKSPIASGTVATIVAGVPCAILLGAVPKELALVFLLLIFMMACYVSGEAERELGGHDRSEIVIDELVGYLVTMIALPVTLPSILLGVAAFRLFDIWKPWPVSFIDARIGGGLGVVLDDFAAGILAHLLTWAALALWC